MKQRFWGLPPLRTVNRSFLRRSIQTDCPSISTDVADGSRTTQDFIAELNKLDAKGVPHAAGPPRSPGRSAAAPPLGGSSGWTPTAPATGPPPAGGTRAGLDPDSADLDRSSPGDLLRLT